MSPVERYFFCYEVSFCDARVEDIYNFARDHHSNCWGYHKADDGFSLFLSRGGMLALLRDETLSSRVRESRSLGLFPFLFRHRARAGLAVGGMLALFLFLLSSKVVWDVRVVGNDRYTVEYLKSSFARSGLTVGTPIASFDRDAFVAEYLQKEDALSYLAVNFRGTVAYVQVMERLAPSEDPQKSGGANLVAAEDAVIHSLSVSAGKPLVAVGSVVRKGQGLVSGITEGAGGSRLVYAKGEVIGRVRHTLTVEVDRRQIKKEPLKPILVGATLNFFGKELNIFEKSNNYNDTYDTIYKDKSFYVTKSARIPITLTLAYAPVYTESPLRLSERETVSLALSRMNEEMTLFVRDKELLSRRLEGQFVGDRYLLTCEIECLENIAETREFSLG